MFRTVAGKTTPTNNGKNPTPPGNPTIVRADVKKITPEIIVPNAVIISVESDALTNRLSITYKTYTIIDVNTLSMMFGTKPPGKELVRPDKKPVTIPKMKLFLSPGNKMIPKNIINSIISGFIPLKIGGIIP